MIQSLFQWHENERLLARVQTVIGALILWAVASALLWWLGASVIPPAALAVVMAFPSRKRLVLSLAALGFIAERCLDFTSRSMPLGNVPAWVITAAVVAATVAGLYAAFRLAGQFARWPSFARTHPVLVVHAGVWIAIWAGTFPGLGILGLAAFFAWRLSYLVMAASRDKLANARFSDHLFYLAPAWGGTTTPYGKGLDFLSRHEAGTALAMARSQLAGIKLLLLAVAWTYARELLDLAFFGRAAQHLGGWPTAFLDGWTLGLPRLQALIRGDAQTAWHLAWASTYLELIRATLNLAISGHLIIGSLRLLGFNVFRNTYKPLLSTSVLEFWNRYYYYFKELLVDFFFYPTYLRLRTLSPAARMLAAVFAAAFVGNMYYHVMTSPGHLLRFDLEGLWAHWSPRLVYCSLLALGIWVSMLRQQKLRAAGDRPGRWTQLRRIAYVWTFYAIIQIWNVTHGRAGLGECTAFFLSLFGL